MEARILSPPDSEQEKVKAISPTKDSSTEISIGDTDSNLTSEVKLFIAW